MSAPSMILPQSLACGQRKAGNLRFKRIAACASSITQTDFPSVVVVCQSVIALESSV